MIKLKKKARPHRVGIVGSRDWSKPGNVVCFVALLPSTVEVVSGGSGVVDETAVAAAELCGLPTLVFRARWRAEGKAAGPKRNSKMVAYVDELVAFWDGKSKGTRDAISKAKKAGKPVRVIGEYGLETGIKDADW